MKGVARKPLITLPSARCVRGEARKPPGAVTMSSTASGMPAASAMPPETPTIISVSASALP